MMRRKMQSRWMKFASLIYLRLLLFASLFLKLLIFRIKLSVILLEIIVKRGKKEAQEHGILHGTICTLPKVFIIAMSYHFHSL